MNSCNLGLKFAQMRNLIRQTKNPEQIVFLPLNVPFFVLLDHLQFLMGRRRRRMMRRRRRPLFSLKCPENFRGLAPGQINIIIFGKKSEYFSYGFETPI